MPGEGRSNRAGRMEPLARIVQLDRGYFLRYGIRGRTALFAQVMSKS